MIRIQVIPTWRCNYYDFKKKAPHGKNCKYCVIYSPMEKSNTYFQHNSTIRKIAKELTPEEWLDGALAIREFSNDQILFDFTGGEPTLYNDFDILVNILSSIPNTRWAITSNTSLRDKIQDIFKHDASRDRILGWTASWHPNGIRPFDKFIANLLLIKEYTQDISVTIVLHESTMDRIESDIEALNGLGIRNQIHLYHEEGFSLSDKIKNTKLLEVFNRLKHKNKQDSLSWEDNMEGVKPLRDCNAGMKSVTVSSDGKIFLCYEHMNGEPNTPYIGQWGEFYLNETPIKNCNWTCRYACDRMNIINKE